MAGLFALLAPVGTDMDQLTPFLAEWGGGPNRDMLASLAWYAPTAVAILGGMLTMLLPALGAVLMLLAAVGWLAIALSNQIYFTFHILGPAGAALAGALLGFLIAELGSRRRRDEPDERRPARRTRPDPDEDAREAAFNMDPRLVMREEAPPRPAREIPLTLEDVAPAESRSEPPRRRTDSIWPDAPDGTGRRSIFDRIDVTDMPRRSLIPERETADKGRGRPNEAEGGTEPRKRLFAWLAVANVLVVIGLGAVIGYNMLQDRDPSAATATAGTLPAAADTPAAAATQAAAAQAAAAAAERLSPNLWPSLPDPANANVDTATVGSTQIGAIPAAATVGGSGAASAGGFADPHAYCAGLRDINYVDARYTGPRFTADIADALRVPLESAPDRVSWRCVNGVVYACASFDWPVCAMTPTAGEMLEYCRRNPSVPRLLAPNGTWSCVAGRPNLPEGASWPVDERGFFPNAWIPVPPPAGVAPQAG